MVTRITLLVAFSLTLGACSGKAFYELPAGTLSPYYKTEPGFDGVKPRASYSFVLHSNKKYILIYSRKHGGNRGDVFIKRQGKRGMPVLFCACDNPEHTCEIDWSAGHLTCKGCKHGETTSPCKLKEGLWADK